MTSPGTHAELIRRRLRGQVESSRPGTRHTVAKGNDGNYLQHSIEVAIAWQLVTRIAGSRLHIALTHGMAPYEPCGSLPNGQTRALLGRGS